MSFGIGYYDKNGDEITMAQWGIYLQDPNYRIVRQESIGAVEVSTVWLGLDHGFDPDRPPLIFETMCFGLGEYEEECYRYATEDAALKGHERLVAELKLLQEALA